MKGLKRSRPQHWGTFRGVQGNVLDWHIIENEFEFQLRYYVYFLTNAPWERYEPPYPPNHGLNSTITVIQQDGFGIRWLTKVDIP